MQETFNFGHFIPISTIDWHGRSASVLFFRGCQFRCPYCQNYAYLDHGNEMKIAEIESQIEKAAPYISAVVFSGGEPTLQPDALKTLARFVKSKSLSVGLQTNGFGYNVIKDMLDENILDKLFIDIKAPLDDPVRYSKVIGSDIQFGTKTVENIISSLNSVLASGIEVEVRTTVFRGLADIEEVQDIAAYLNGLAARNLTYVIQQGMPDNTLDMKDIWIYNREELLDMARFIQGKCLKNIWLRTKENGDEMIL
ncbi:MAG TPA: anaerobic ribonucleoside-triphosphate reductase activating protein [Candidatus Nanoarchaeia archaeon]|nr:anaerobic ribonucleoside-triphosphate reductase activating protein [Candidatus Nanoarchaeia archaeon]